MILLIGNAGSNTKAPSVNKVSNQGKISIKIDSKAG
jgi:hypothetical protein